jgi:hypothetical protein
VVLLPPGAAVVTPPEGTLVEVDPSSLLVLLPQAALPITIATAMSTPAARLFLSGFIVVSVLGVQTVCPNSRVPKPSSRSAGTPNRYR